MKLYKLAIILLFLISVFMLAEHRRIEDFNHRSAGSDPEQSNVVAGAIYQKSVKQCLEQFGLELTDAFYMEEPYGQLAALRFDTIEGGWIEFRLSCLSKVYSTDGIWDIPSVLSSKVAEVMDDRKQLIINQRILEITKHEKVTGK